MIHLSGIQQEFWFWLKENKHILFFTPLAFILRAIPHMFMIPLLAIEEEFHWLFVGSLLNGDFSSVFRYPHSVHFLVAGVRWIFSIPPGFVESYIYPVLGALLIPCMVYFLRGLQVSKKTEIITIVLITFLEIHIYRSTTWSGDEILAVNLLVLQFGLLTRKKWIPSFVILLLLTQTHYLALSVGVLVITIYGYLCFELKNKILLTLGLIAVGVVAVVFFPYTMSIRRFEYTFQRFNLMNTFLLYSPQELLGAIILYPITVICLFSLLFYIVKGDKVLLKILGVVVYFLTFIALIFYNPVLIGPYRLVIYGGLAGVICVSITFSRLFPTKVIILILIVLSSLSLLTVYPNGLYKVQSLNLVATNEEVEAAYWISCLENFVVANVATDLTNYGILIYISNYYIKSSEPLRSPSELVVTKNPVTEPPKNWEGLNQTKYIFWSKRMEKEGLFYNLKAFENSFERITYYVDPIPDLWYNNSNFTLIYDSTLTYPNTGVKIYEKITS